MRRKSDRAKQITAIRESAEEKAARLGVRLADLEKLVDELPAIRSEFEVLKRRLMPEFLPGDELTERSRRVIRDLCGTPVEDLPL
jgi:hypothetical protein